MIKKIKKMSLGNVIVVAALTLIFLSGTVKNVMAAQGNESYQFVFGYEGDTKTTGTRTKEESGDAAYINCTYAENDNASFYAWFYFWNDYDGTQHTNESVTLWNDSQRWVANSATGGDSTWFLAKLNSSGFSEDEGGIFEGRWRPDSSR